MVLLTLLVLVLSRRRGLAARGTYGLRTLGSGPGSLAYLARVSAMRCSSLARNPALLTGCRACILAHLRFSSVTGTLASRFRLALTSRLRRFSEVAKFWRTLEVRAERPSLCLLVLVPYVGRVPAFDLRVMFSCLLFLIRKTQLFTDPAPPRGRAWGPRAAARAAPVG